MLHIVKNYTGDVLNFETAAELAAAEDIEVSAVVVDDDVAVKDSTWTAGRRGVGGTVLVEKIAGAAAARGDDLAAVTAIAERVSSQVRSMGMALTAVHRPALRRAVVHAGRRRDGDRRRHPRRARPGTGQAGARRRDRRHAARRRSSRTCRSSPATTPCCSSTAWGARRRSSCTWPTIPRGQFLAERGIEVTRSLVGNYITSLEMQGMSITLLKLDDEMTELWDAPVHTAALRWGV